MKYFWVATVYFSLIACALAQTQKLLPEKFWQTVEAIPQNRAASEAWIQPRKFHAFNIDHDMLQTLLAKAPLEFSKQARVSMAEINLPMPDGTGARFRIVESPVMAPELAAKFPEIKTYLGQGIDDRSATLRCDVTPQGFHAQILSPHGSVYIDPYWRGDRILHTSYYKRDYQKAADDFHCVVVEEDTEEPQEPTAQRDLLRSGSNLRTYRLACAATGEYTQFHGGTVSGAMSAIVTAINRVTGVYEVEVAIRLVLVANNDLIIYTNGSTDPYSNSDGSAMLTQNQSNLTSVTGSANYDIGHVFSTGGGGIATLGCVCKSSLKAKGVTGLSSPTGDSFYIDYVAHEMGHQFGANHTFNSVSGSCSGNRNASTAYEPGSGSTIMAYAGICSPDNLQSHSDPYFHSVSFDEIIAYSTTGSGNNCPVVTSTGNTAPTVNAGRNYNIPKGTPFTLTASGSDPDTNDLVNLNYCWEERDLGASQTISDPDNGSSPIFRSFSPVSDPSRTFPKLSSILNNTSTTGEKPPTTGRTMNFRVTVRDNRSGGGGVNTSNMQVIVSAAAGPFVITSPNTAVNWSGGQTVTWNVAGTTAAPINATNVNILLSTNGGNSFPIVLATNVPNDGSEMVLLPDLFSTTARIKVEAAGNIFFDISDANFSITPSTAMPVVSLASATLASENCSPGNNAIDPNETVSLNFALKNVGSASLTNLVATLLATNGVTLPSGAQTYGALMTNGATVTRAFTFTASGICGGNISPTLKLQDGTNNLGNVSAQFVLGGVMTNAASFTNTESIFIPELGTATPYPSSIAVSGMSGSLIKATVSVLDFHHTYPADVLVLLVSPNNHTVLLMDEAGGGQEVDGVNLTFDSSAVANLPSDTQIVSGTYLPTDYGSGDSLPSPAPGSPYSSALTSLNGINPNGTWRLYVYDAEDVDDGGINGGWKINLTTTVANCCTDQTPPTVQSVTQSNGIVTLAWTAIFGNTYRVQYKDDLNDANWNDLAGDIVANGTTATKMDASGLVSQRFYRIVLVTN